MEMDSLWKGFERRPGDPVLFNRLRSELESKDDFEGLVDLYRRRAKAVAPEEAVYLYLAVAEVWCAQTSDVEFIYRGLHRGTSRGKSSRWDH